MRFTGNSPWICKSYSKNWKKHGKNMKKTWKNMKFTCFRSNLLRKPGEFTQHLRSKFFEGLLGVRIFLIASFSINFNGLNYILTRSNNSKNKQSLHSLLKCTIIRYFFGENWLSTYKILIFTYLHIQFLCLQSRNKNDIIFLFVSKLKWRSCKLSSYGTLSNKHNE